MCTIALLLPSGNRSQHQKTQLISELVVRYYPAYVPMRFHVDDVYIVKRQKTIHSH
jgi:hypothetical protein